MGGERAATTRQRLAGKICWRCKTVLDPPTRPGERLCARCTPKHRVRMTFDQYVDHWHVCFLEADGRTSVSERIHNISTLEAVRAILIRASTTPEDLAEFDRDVRRWGRGSIFLNLTPQQYAKLKAKR